MGKGLPLDAELSDAMVVVVQCGDLGITHVHVVLSLPSHLLVAVIDEFTRLFSSWRDL